MPNTQYVSVDTASANWSPVHALATMLYLETYAQSHNPESPSTQMNVRLFRDSTFDISNLPQEAQQPIKAIRAFFNTQSDREEKLNHIEAEEIKTGLVPHVFNLYQSLALDPNLTADQLATVLGSQAANKFMSLRSTFRQSPDGSAQPTGLMDKLQQKVQAWQNNNDLEENTQQDNSMLDSEEITEHMMSLFCHEKSPHIYSDYFWSCSFSASRLFDLFGTYEHSGCEQDYALRLKEDGRYELLVNTNAAHLSPHFNTALFNRSENPPQGQAQYYCKIAPGQLEYYFGNWSNAVRTTLGLLVIAGTAILTAMAISQASRTFTGERSPVKPPAPGPDPAPAPSLDPDPALSPGPKPVITHKPTQDSTGSVSTQQKKNRTNRSTPIAAEGPHRNFPG